MAESGYPVITEKLVKKYFPKKILGTYCSVTSVMFNEKLRFTGSSLSKTHKKFPNIVISPPVNDEQSQKSIQETENNSVSQYEMDDISWKIFPKNPCKTPSYYPQDPLKNYNKLHFFMKLAPESLFFYFYYMEETLAQYMAAKVLKEYNWRFHTKYKMWFIRYEDPEISTMDFEQGVYLVFDYENWTLIKKTNFLFEYKYLEDTV